MNLRQSLRNRLPLHRPNWLNLLPLFLAGGRWSVNVAVSVRKNLRRLIISGILNNISDAVVNTYQAVYLVALGASRAEIGLMSSLSNITMPIAMLPGGRLATRRGRYKPLVILPSLLGRMLLLGLIIVPNTKLNLRVLVYLSIAFAVARTFVLNFVMPAHTALLGKLVPIRWRGRYFSARNIFMGGAAFLILLGVGQLIDLLGNPLGYQVALGIAVLAALGSAFALLNLGEDAVKTSPESRASTADFLKRVREQQDFLRACGISTLWSFGVNIASPFFFVFLADQIETSSGTLGVISAVSTLASLPAQRLFGRWLDRKGTAWVKRLTGLLIPLVPGLWGFIRQPWQAIPLQIFSGFVWAGYNLSSFNFLLEITPEDTRPRFVALQQSLAGLGMAAGAGLGGWIAETSGYTAVFLSSASGRLIAALVFALSMAKVHPLQWLWSKITKSLSNIKQKLRERTNKMRSKQNGKK
jgi:MFS family permease